MYLRSHERSKDGKNHTYWSLVETTRTVEGPRQRTLCYLGELNDTAQARWLKTIEVFNEQGESQQLKLFPSEVEVGEEEVGGSAGGVGRECGWRGRAIMGNCYVGLELWRRLGLENFFAERLDRDPAEVPWSRVAAVLAINRVCAPEQ